jgi:membrane protease YdiL (CAAX protease family)
VLAIFITALSVGLTMSLASSLADKAHRIMWPELLGAGAALVSYAIYVRLMEKRPVFELSRANAITELGAGLLIGALMVVSVIGMLAALGAYQITGREGWSMKIIIPLGEMTLVGVFEEILCRGIIFRIVEKTLGSWLAFVISALLFGLAHTPGGDADFLAIAITVVAGALFSAAYRRRVACGSASASISLGTTR